MDKRFEYQRFCRRGPPPWAASLSLPFLLVVTTSGTRAQDASTGDGGAGLILVILLLLVLQSLLILGLHRSRARYKRARANLKRSQRALEDRVVERTNKLRNINDQLYDEISNHEITEELLQETQNYLQSMINSMPSILIGVTREGIVTQWNSAAEGATGIAAGEAIGQYLEDVAPDLEVESEMIQNAIDQGVTQVKERLRHQLEEETAYTDLIVYPLMAEELSGAVIRIDDVTTRVRFENIMIQNEKMMSLGELAAGMAHELNNPISAILQAVQNIRRRTTPGLSGNDEAANNLGITVEQVRTYLEARRIDGFLDSIKDAGERSAGIVTNMLEFSRASGRSHRPVDMVELLEHSLELSQSSSELKDPRTAHPPTIRREYQEQLPRVRCSPPELQQVILNILRNAAQSFSSAERPDGEAVITIRVFTAGNYLRIQVADNGPGMAESTRRHIFEPFFTTKEVGKGTGLGLSVSYFIITEHHNGHIEVDSAEGRGTTFSISLPLQPPALSAVSAASPDTT